MSFRRAAFALWTLIAAAGSAAAQPVPGQTPNTPATQVGFSERAYLDSNSVHYVSRSFDRTARGLSGAQRSAAWALHSRNFSTAMQRLTILAQSGDAWAYRHLGWLYAQGFGVPRDARLAFANFHEAARLGDAPSALAVGLAFQLGDGVPADAALADHWLARAERDGNRAVSRDAARLRRRS